MFITYTICSSQKKKKLTPFAIIFLALCICATVIDEPLISHESTTHSHISWFQRLSLQIISKLLELYRFSSIFFKKSQINIMFIFSNINITLSFNLNSSKTIMLLFVIFYYYYFTFFFFLKEARLKT